jgi:hypothetical protein
MTPTLVQPSDSTADDLSPETSPTTLHPAGPESASLRPENDPNRPQVQVVWGNTLPAGMPSKIVAANRHRMVQVQAFFPGQPTMVPMHIAINPERREKTAIQRELGLRGKGYARYMRAQAIAMQEVAAEKANSVQQIVADAQAAVQSEHGSPAGE